MNPHILFVFHVRSFHNLNLNTEASKWKNELQELREENKALRQQITELTERLQNLELIIQEQIKVMLDTLVSLKNQ